MSSDRLIGYMQKLGKTVADQYRSGFVGLNEEERLKNLLALMQELGWFLSPFVAKLRNPGCGD